MTFAYRQDVGDEGVSGKSKEKESQSCLVLARLHRGGYHGYQPQGQGHHVGS